ncbi:MAG: DUF6588 family protein [Salinivirgaceae bacterium]|jgi:hypothetical protein
MKKILTISLLVLVLGSQSMKAQNLSSFSLSQLNPYVNAYTEPFAVAMPIGLSGGWAHTAKVHSTLGFDVTFSTSVIMIPSSAGTVKASSINMPNNIQFSDPTADVPTIRGNKDLVQPNISIPLSVGEEGTPNYYTSSIAFPAFKGLGMGLSASAAIQAAVGLPKGTEVIIRFIPNLANTANKLIPDGVDVKMEKTNMWGLGVKHDIKQWIPVLSKVPFLQISGLVGYTKFQTGFSGGALAITPNVLSITNGTLANNTALWDDQKFLMEASSFTGSLLVGASIPVFQPFIGIGFNSGKFESGFYGTYPVVDINSTNGNLEVNKSEKDPLVIENKTTNFNFQAGARIKLGPIVFHYAIAMQKYTMHTFGFAVTLR